MVPGRSGSGREDCPEALQGLRLLHVRPRTGRVRIRAGGRADRSPRDRPDRGRGGAAALARASAPATARGSPPGGQKTGRPAAVPRAREGVPEGAVSDVTWPSDSEPADRAPAAVVLAAVAAPSLPRRPGCRRPAQAVTCGCRAISCRSRCRYPGTLVLKGCTGCPAPERCCTQALSSGWLPLFLTVTTCGFTGRYFLLCRPDSKSSVRPEPEQSHYNRDGEPEFGSLVDVLLSVGSPGPLRAYH